MKHFNKKAVVIVCVLAVVLMWGIRVMDVRKRFPAKQITECRINESIEYNPVIENIISANTTITPLGLTIYKHDEYIKDFPKMAEQYNAVKNYESLYAIVPTFSIHNNGTEPINAGQITAFFEIVNMRNSYSNGLMIMNNIVVQPGMTETVYMTALVSPSTIGQENWSDFINGDFIVLISQYPVEQRLLYEKGKNQYRL